MSTGLDNTASGEQALHNNTTGDSNAAFGVNALQLNTTGSNNTAVGAAALQLNTTGFANVALGGSALLSNTIGSENTASGEQALQNNTLGSGNTASGDAALYYNKYGSENTASGFDALFSNSWGNHNTASGVFALYRNTSGSDNIGVGYFALFSNITGQDNVAIGTKAGSSVTGNNNIDIGSTGFAGESGIIRIGGASQSAAYIAGISSTQLTGSPVYVSANGQLGVLASSERYKTEIAPMGGGTKKLHELRPVSFHLKNDPKGAVQYGLIAEEVNKVFPELVIRDNAGTIQGVRYDELAPMLLNEVQQQAAEIRDLRKLVVEMQAGLLKLQAKEELLAQR